MEREEKIMGLKMNEIRMLESYITKKFLADNSAVVKELLDIFNQNLKQKIAAGNGEIEKFYIKGGNAFSMLEKGMYKSSNDDSEKNVALTGDFDFQLIPKKNVNRENLDKTIMELLQDTISQFLARHRGESSLWEETAFDNIASSVTKISDKDLKNTLLSIHHNIGKRILQKSDELQDEIAIIKIGKTIEKSYLKKTAEEILSDKNYMDGRLCIPETEISWENVDGKHPITIYANYTIPEFILYRIVYRRPFTGKKEVRVLDNTGKQQTTDKDLFLKSEIIDISVPRTGSTELILATGLEPYYIKPDRFSFMIPGWGYHFYENLNLLQENELKISGSPWKKNKRLERGKTALREICAINYMIVLKKLCLEDNNAGIKDADGKGSIKSVCEMYTYQLSMLTEISVGLKNALKECITNDIKSGCGNIKNIDELMTVLPQLGTKIASLQCDKNDLVNKIKKINKIIQKQLGDMGSFFKYVLDDSVGSDSAMPVNFVIAKCKTNKIGVVDAILNANSDNSLFFKETKPIFKNEGNQKYFLAKLRIPNSCIYYAIDFVDDITDCQRIQPEELLENSMFVVQRKTLIDNLRKKQGINK